MKCKKIVHPAQLKCVVVIPCVSGATGSNLAMIWGATWKIDFTLKDEQFKISHTFLINMTFPIAIGLQCTWGGPYSEMVTK